MTTTVHGYPEISERSRGWLRYLYRKATTPDNWDKDGQPHPHWDDVSDEPRRSFPRFDLIESGYAMGLMADATPAWREIYSTILDELNERSTSWWAVVDWLTQIGNDPRRNQYPEEWYEAWIPKFLRVRYDTPGWTSNGVEPWGRQGDAMHADGIVGWKGNYLTSLGLQQYVSGDDKWNQPFDMIRDGGNTFTHTYTEIAHTCSICGRESRRAATARIPRYGPCDWITRASV